MAKPQPTQLNSKELKLECRYIIDDAFSEVKAICDEHIVLTQKELKKLKQLYSKDTVKLKSLTKKLKETEKSFKNKPTAVLKKRLKSTSVKLSSLSKSQSKMKKDIDHLSQELVHFKVVKRDQVAKTKALRVLKNNIAQNTVVEASVRVTAQSKVKEQPMSPVKNQLSPASGSDMVENLSGSVVEEGSLAPVLSALISEDQQHLLKDAKGKNIVLYFYPKDNTPGCTKQAIDFTSSEKQFADLDAVVIGVSRDTLKSHEKFTTKHALTHTLLSDPSELLCQAFGVIRDKNMYGKVVKGIQRSTFVIDQDGKVLKIWRGVKVPNHVDNVLESLAR